MTRLECPGGCVVPSRDISDAEGKVAQAAVNDFCAQNCQDGCLICAGSVKEISAAQRRVLQGAINILKENARVAKSAADNLD